MMNARAVTEPMNIQWRQRKLRYWRRSNVRSGGSASILVGTLNPFIGWDPPLPRKNTATNLRPAREQETPLVFFQNQTGQAPGRIGGRVNSDPIGANLWDY